VGKPGEGEEKRERGGVRKKGGWWTKETVVRYSIFVTLKLDGRGQKKGGPYQGERGNKVEEINLTFC